MAARGDRHTGTCGLEQRSLRCCDNFVAAIKGCCNKGWDGPVLFQRHRPEIREVLVLLLTEKGRLPFDWITK
jgi:hypothetical protein